MPDLKKNVSLKSLKVNAIDIRYVFVVILLVIFALEILVLKDAVGIVMGLENQQAPIATRSVGVRINFKDYETIVKRIEGASSYHPTSSPTRNPFAPPPSQ